jgi:hypothetical protein
MLECQQNLKKNNVMRISQTLTAPSVNFFKKNFIERYNFKEYYDVNKPCVFLGGNELSHQIQNHKSYKFVFLTSPHDLPDFNIVTNTDNLFIINLLDEVRLNSKIPNNVNCRNVTIEIKDYSLFQPNVLGDKIYAYTGFKNGWTNQWNIEKLKQIQKQINYEIITTNHLNINDYYDINYLKNNYYDKSFLNLNLSNGNGMATVIELGLMGRKTILNEHFYKFPCILNYKNDEDLINLINSESYKIGTLQPSINCHTVNDEWLDINFWTKTNK